MNRINYNKVLKQLIDKHPHNIEAIKKVISDIKKNSISLELTTQDIVDNFYAGWNESEIYELFKALDVNPYEIRVKEYNREYRRDDDQYLFTYLVNQNKRVVFLGALKRMFDLNNGHSKMAKTYKELIYFIYASNAEFATKVEYLGLLLDNTPEDILKEQIPTKYTKAFFDTPVQNVSIFPDIIKSSSIDLVKKYASYLNGVEDLTLYLPYAVEKGNLDIVKYFLDEGADPNYCPDSKIKGYLSPLKVAIKHNNKDMYELLKSYGARVNQESRLNESTYKTFEGDYQKKMNLMDRDMQVLTSPLEYALELDEHPTENSDNCWYIANFYSSRVRIYYDKLSEDAYNRSLMIDDMYESIGDKSTIDFTKLLIATFATRNLDLFKKYANYALENKVKIDSAKLIDAFYTFKIGEGKNPDEIIDFFLDFLESYQVSDEDLLLNMLETHYNRRSYTMGYQHITVSSLLLKLLDRVPEDKRKHIPFIVYLKTLDEVKTLEGYGYNVNMLDEMGHNILYHLLVEHYKIDGYNKEKLELIDYLLDNVNLSQIDNEGHNILYHMLRKFDTHEEDRYSKVREHRNNIEDITVKLINKMNNEDVNREDNMTVIQGRVITYNSNFGDHMYPELIYQHHEDLFQALINKKCKFSDNFYASIFTSIYPKENEPLNREILEKEIDVDETLSFIFEKLDKNTKVQCLNINEAFDEIKAYLKAKDATFEGFAKKFIDFNNHVVELKDFYQKNILEKYSPTRYREYAEHRYKTTYDGLDDMILSLIISVIIKFPEEDIDTILSLCPNYDINHTVDGLTTDYNYWTYAASLQEMVPTDVENVYDFVPAENRFEANFANCCLDEDDEYIELYGGLVHFAILINNLDMVKKLVAKGANLEYFYEGEGCSFQYVSSKEMEEYMESILGDGKLDDLESEDKNYYLSLLGTSESTN